MKNGYFKKEEKVLHMTMSNTFESERDLEGEREIASKRESEIVFFKDSNNFCLACSDMIWTFSSVR